MRQNDFIFHSVQLLYYKCDRINFRCSGSYIDSPNWIRKKKATIIQKNKDDKCFQYAAKVALNHERLEWHLERTSNVKLLETKTS